MQKIINSLRHVKLVFRRSRPLTKIVVLCAIVLSMVTLLTLQAAIVESEARIAALREQAFELEQNNEDLEQYIAELGSVQSILRIAMEKLGLVEPDTVIITPQQ